MGKLPVVMLYACGVTGCASNVSNGADCDVEGIYSISSDDELKSGSCPETGDSAPVAVTIKKVSPTAVSLVIQGMPGACPAKLSGCSLLADCTVRTKTGEIVTTWQSSWKFSGQGFTGTTVMGTGAATDGGAECRMSSHDIGTRN